MRKERLERARYPTQEYGLDLCTADVDRLELRRLGIPGREEPAYPQIYLRRKRSVGVLVIQVTYSQPFPVSTTVSSLRTLENLITILYG